MNPIINLIKEEKDRYYIETGNIPSSISICHDTLKDIIDETNSIRGFKKDSSVHKKIAEIFNMKVHIDNSLRNNELKFR